MSEDTKIYGQSDAVAVAVADTLNAASEASALCLEVAAERLFARKLDAADISKIGDPATIEVFPGDDLADRMGIDGTYDDTYGCHILILQNVTDTVSGGLSEDQCALLCRLRSQIVEYLCARPLSSANAVHPFAGARVKAVRSGIEGAIYDLTRLETNNVFYSELIVTYKAAGLRRRNG